MYEYSAPQALVRTVRELASLTQRELATRAGVAQPVISRLETSPDANPSVQTVAAVAAAAGFRLRVIVEPIEEQDPVVERYKRDVDRTLIRENLRRSAQERITTLGEWQEAGAALQGATRAAKRRRP
jgi:transcriptional regulator with XRE-family HTH domain